VELESRSATATGARRPIGRPRKLPYAVREQVLLDAATVAFADRGSSAVPVGAIAARARINKALIYEHFASKDQLFAAAVLRERDRLVDFIAARYGRSVGRPARERVRDQYHAFLDFAADHPDGIRLLGLPEAAAVLDGAGRDALTVALAQHLEHELGRAGLPTNELPQILAAMFVGMAGSVIRRGAHANWDREGVVDLLTDFTLAGLAGVDRSVLDRADTPP
jgi:AcrR family transcriptional regulator